MLSEGSGISTLLEEKVAIDQKQAGEDAVKAGADVGISYEAAYMAALIENVEEGRVPIALIDRAVRRILRQKFTLALFENRVVNVDNAVKIAHAEPYQHLALQAARESIVVLKNENGMLPLRSGLKTIAVIGPNADNSRNQLGDYISHVTPQHIVTPLEGIRQRAGSGAKVLYAKGAEVLAVKTVAVSLRRWPRRKRPMSPS